MTAPIQRLPRGLPAPTSAAAVITRLLTTAASQIGYREGRSSSGNWNNDNAFGSWYGSNGVAWCAQFVSWAAHAAGIPTTVIPKHQYTPTGWNWFTARDHDVTTPRAGDLLYVYGYVSTEGRNRVHHVGIVERILSGGRIQTIEGNTNTSGSAQGNGVYRLVRPVNSRLRFARPPYQLAVVRPPTPKPPTKEDEMSQAQYDALMKEIRAVREEVRDMALWEVLHGLEAEDERSQARETYAAARAAGKTVAEAKAAAYSVLRPLADAIRRQQKE